MVETYNYAKLAQDWENTLRASANSDSKIKQHDQHTLEEAIKNGLDSFQLTLDEQAHRIKYQEHNSLNSVEEKQQYFTRSLNYLKNIECVESNQTDEVVANIKEDFYDTLWQLSFCHPDQLTKESCRKLASAVSNEPRILRFVEPRLIDTLVNHGLKLPRQTPANDVIYKSDLEDKDREYFLWPSELSKLDPFAARVDLTAPLPYALSCFDGILMELIKQNKRSHEYSALGKLQHAIMWSSPALLEYGLRECNNQLPNEDWRSLIEFAMNYQIVNESIARKIMLIQPYFKPYKDDQLSMVPMRLMCFSNRQPKYFLPDIPLLYKYMIDLGQHKYLPIMSESMYQHTEWFYNQEIVYDYINYDDHWCDLSVISYACEIGNVDAVETLINQKDITFFRSMPLMHAAKNGHVECMDKLFAAEDNAKSIVSKINDGILKISHRHCLCAKSKVYALIKSVNGGHEDCVERLLARYLDLLKDELTTALWVAIKKGYTNIARKLIEAGADLSMWVKTQHSETNYWEFREPFPFGVEQISCNLIEEHAPTLTEDLHYRRRRKISSDYFYIHTVELNEEISALIKQYKNTVSDRSNINRSDDDLLRKTSIFNQDNISTTPQALSIK